MAKGKTHETVAYSSEATECLAAAIKDTLSPEAVAAIVAHLGSVQTNNQSVNQQAAWFREFLIDLLGVEQVNAMCEELGL